VPTITYLQTDGSRRHVFVRPGMSLVEAALRFDIPGIDANCRGNCACVTCHVHIADAWSELLGRPGPMEQSMLDFAEGVDAGSRLACQVRVTEACDGMIVAVAATQHTPGL
jgi:2Fe-2S ferredoxin